MFIIDWLVMVVCDRVCVLYFVVCWLFVVRCWLRVVRWLLVVVRGLLSLVIRSGVFGMPLFGGCRFI